MSFGGRADADFAHSVGLQEVKRRSIGIENESSSGAQDLAQGLEAAEELGELRIFLEFGVIFCGFGVALGAYFACFSFSFGDVSMEIQPLLDKILPAMIPAAITGSAYYLLTKKNASMTALILVVIVLAMVASAVGILA